MFGTESPEKKAAIHRLVKDFELEHEKYERVMHLMDHELSQGLGKATNPNAIVKMFPTYVRSLPDGSEKGDYLALDLGGTNFRVLLIHLEGSKFTMENKIFPISEEIMTGPGVNLFNHIAECLDTFLKERNMGNQTRLPLGFTFSFPCKQEGLAVGRLVRWTKGFRCSGVEGRDVVKLLHEALERKGLNIECVAILNDTVGCLMSCAFKDHKCEIGVILGTGTNACYMEKLDKVDLWDADRNEPKQVVINTEWGAFGDNGCIDFLRTHHDKDIDNNSLNPGKQVYEKMISGMYMGEIARRAIVECAKQTPPLLFGGEVTDELATSERFYTKYISEAEKDDPEGKGNFKYTRQVLDEMGYDDVSFEDCKAVNYICHLVGERAAYLASAGIAALLNRVAKEDITVAVDGSLYRFHPKFHDFMMKKISELTKHKFTLVLSQDGSGRGAAFVAAVLMRLRQQKQQ